jgi:hypothetical protein
MPTAPPSSTGDYGLPNRSLSGSGTISAPTGPGDAKLIPGGYQGTPTKGEATKWVQSSHGGAASLNTSVPPIDAPVTEAEATDTTLSADVARFNTDVDEVTINSDYYPTTQPFLARMVLQFPSYIQEEEYKETTQAPGSGVLAPQGTGFFTPQATQQAPGSGVLASTAPGVSFGSYDSYTTTTNTQVVPVYNNDAPEGDYLEIRPNNFLNMDYDRMIDGIGKFHITLFDPQWDRIEKKLVANRGYFKYQYGYTDGGAGTMSPWLEALAIGYNLTFSMEGVTIVISGFTLGYKLNFTKTFDALGVNKEKISDIAKKIAENLGMEPIIEPTRPITSRDGIDTTDVINKIINMSSQTHLGTIIHDLEEHAVNEKNQGGYHFCIITPPTGKPEFHFHTVFYEPKTPAGPEPSTNILDTDNPAVPQTSGSSTKTKTIPGFTQFRNKNSALISFNPNWMMSLSQLLGGGGLVAPIIDAENKVCSVATVTSTNTPQCYDNKSGGVVIPCTDFVPPKFGNNDTIKSFRILRTSARSADQNTAITQAAFSNNHLGAADANLTIFGTPNFHLLQKIAVFIFKPQGDNTEATTDNVHWISGFFRIIRIHDHISAGKFITTLGLITDGRGNVAPDTVPSTQS